jgi:hypothetical protein
MAAPRALTPLWSRFPPSLVRTTILFLSGIALLTFTIMVWRARWNGVSDFDQVYIAATVWRRGIPSLWRDRALLSRS